MHNVLLINVNSNIMKNLFLFAIPAILCCSCASTNLVYLSVLEPAPVSLSPNIKSVAIVNRTQAAESARAIDVADKIFSLEGVHLDRDGAIAGINGLSDELLKNNRFSYVKVLDQPELRNATPGIFPSPLNWDLIERLCRENGTDAIFAMEFFDTDSKISYTANKVSLKTPLGNIPAIEHNANMRTIIKTGWRIYNPSEKSILDKYILDKNISFSGKGINPLAAASAIVYRKDAVKEIAEKTGHEYALRILPYWIRVNREYFVRGNESFFMAKRKAQTGNWTGAAALWQKETSSSDPKIAGRACYNMAIISEINGELDNALKWAQRAYEDYRIRLGLDYIRLLQIRKANNGILKMQQSEASN